MNSLKADHPLRRLQAALVLLADSRNFKATRNDAKRIEGTYVDPDDGDRESLGEEVFAKAGTGDFPKIELKFAVDVN